MERRRVVITGMGALTPLGLTAAESWAAVKAGKCGIAPITLYDASNMKAKLAGEVKGFDPANYMEKREARKVDRFAQLALAAAKEAVEQSGLDMSKEKDPYRCGVIFSTGIGGLITLQNECMKGSQKGFDKVSPHGHRQHGLRPHRHPIRPQGHGHLSHHRLRRRHQRRG